MSQANLEVARLFLDKLAHAVRDERNDTLSLSAQDTFHFGEGYLQALLDFSVLTPEEHTTLQNQFDQWPAPLAVDGSLWKQPWVEHGTKPLVVRRVDLGVLSRPRPSRHLYSCEFCCFDGHVNLAKANPGIKGKCEQCNADVELSLGLNQNTEEG